MLTWSPSCESLVAIQPFVCKKRFAQKFTDGRTDDGRLAVAAHSWNELKISLVLCKNYPGHVSALVQYTVG